MPHIMSDEEYRNYLDFKALGMTPAQLREAIDNYEAMFDPSPLPLNLNEEEQDVESAGGGRMMATDYLNPHRIYPDCPSRRIDNPPGFDSIRQGSKEKGGRMTGTKDYIVFDRTGTPHVVVAVKTEIGGDCPQNGNREVEG